MSVDVSEITKIDYSTLSYLKDIWGFIKPYKKKFWVGFFMRFTSDIAGLYPVWAMSKLVVLLTIEVNQDSIVQIGTIMIPWIILAVYHEVFHSLSKYYGYQVAEKTAMDAKVKGLQHIYNLDLSWQEKESSGNKLKRIGNGGHSLNEAIRMFYRMIIESSINTFGILFIFLSLKPQIAFVLIVFMITYFILSLKLTQKASKQYYIENKKDEELEGISFESLNNIRTIKSLSLNESIGNLVIQKAKETLIEIKKRIFYFQGRNGFLGLYYRMFQMSILIWIVSMVLNGDSDIGFLVLFMGYIGKVEDAVFELAEVSHEIVIQKVRFHRLMDILAVKPSIENDKATADYPENWEEIKIENLNFGYGDDKVLNDINLTIKRGEKIGIVGHSGAGKSTLFKLLMDLYEDYNGDIKVGEVSLKSIGRQKYIDNTAVVLQETELFNASLKENILLAAPSGKKIDDKKFEESIQISHMEEVILRLPKGENTVIGEKGVKLSGGEKQRLGIARALYRTPDILLLDEATSHLDVTSEKKIQNSLQTFFKKVTAIVIAHRLSTIKEMDRIIVVEGGKIVENGSFEELINLNGSFADMWAKQRL